jgi:uncharacterized protein (TIGR02996 family)
VAAGPGQWRPIPRERTLNPAHEPFLKEIAAHADLDEPRLVFADWLEERGDLRGEFIRVQCRLARLPRDAAERLELEAREDALLPNCRDAWLRDLPRIRGITWGHRHPWDITDTWDNLGRPLFVRGIPLAIKVKTRAALAQTAAALACMPVVDVQLPPEVFAADDLPECLRQVDGFVMPRSGEAMAALLARPQPCAPLRRVRLGNTESGGTLQALSALVGHADALEALAANGLMNGEPLSRFLESQLPWLEVLDIHSFSVLDRLHLGRIQGLPNLRQLSLSGFALGDGNAVLARPVGARLEALRLPGSDATAELLAASPWVNRLSSLHFDFIGGLSAAGIQSLAGAPQEIKLCGLAWRIRAEGRRASRSKEPLALPEHSNQQRGRQVGTLSR